MTEPVLTRRKLLGYSTLIPLVSLPLLQGCGGTGSACADPDLLSRGEEQMRKAREYADISPVANQACANCQFFHGKQDDGCGMCDILDGRVNQGGHCTSWAERG